MTRAPAEFVNPHKAFTQGVKAGMAGEKTPAPVPWRLMRPVTELHGPRAARQTQETCRRASFLKTTPARHFFAGRPRPVHFAAW
jgi:hypothetical protein